MSPEQRLEGLVLRSSPLGESDRLITLLSNDEGLVRLAAQGPQTQEFPGRRRSPGGASLWGGAAA